MKPKLFFATVLCVVSLLYSCNDTEEKIVTEDKESNVIDYSDKIPDHMLITKGDLPNLVSAHEYSEKLGGYIIVDGVVNENNEVRLLSVKLIKVNNYIETKAASSSDSSSRSDCGEEESYRACARCCTDKPTTVGVMLCTGYCVVDSIDRGLS